MKHLFDTTSLMCSKLITQSYSTSFSAGIKLFSPDIQDSIYAIYGFVRYADEIVDTFLAYDQKLLIEEFEEEYKKALERKISLNPILNAFQKVVHQYELYQYVDDFMARMKWDLEKLEYNTVEDYKNYIYGSADVIGLMCLTVFVNNDQEQFEKLKKSAMHLGSAFQKVNFLRDIKADFQTLGRSYFPNITANNLDERAKQEIVADIELDFAEARKGIVQLPLGAKFGVFVAYKYYLSLLKKLRNTQSHKLLNERIRIPDTQKAAILAKSFVRYKLDLL